MGASPSPRLQSNILPSGPALARIGMRASLSDVRNTTKIGIEGIPRLWNILFEASHISYVPSVVKSVPVITANVTPPLNNIQPNTPSPGHIATAQRTRRFLILIKIEGVIIFLR